MTSEIHFLVIVHGMWGNTSHVRELERIVQEKHSDLHILRAATNQEESTYDGIDWGGERVAQEVLDEVRQLEEKGQKVTRFSIAGYSLGGLLSRYAIGVLRQRGFFENVTPVNYFSVASPHIGLPRYDSFFSSVKSTLGPRLLSRTGEQFYCADKWSVKGRPLLQVMADPERIFYQALAAFESIRIYANAVNDITVPYVTSSIEVHDVFAAREKNGLEIEFYEDYPCLIKSYDIPDIPPAPTPKPLVLSPSWFRSRKPRRSWLPPPLQYRFPFNLVLYAALPVLIPVFLSLAVIRLSLASRSSRARIKLLEKDASSQEKLAYILEQLEVQMEGAIADLIDDDAEGQPGAITKHKKPSPEQPILTPTQRQIAAWLNRLPLKKELAYFEEVRNSHAVIVCRDVINFPALRAGEPALRHLADSFII
ncbi:lipid particle protein [Roridomyces roridus]|uniref:Lipid particle protein n=1 Tax=Roridomyces roridus TaxID=1738132 RepID=A0AAD7FGP1_9AGAR|nr:lipid particle protein [Roridomyces roridus]